MGFPHASHSTTSGGAQAPEPTDEPVPAWLRTGASPVRPPRRAELPPCKVLFVCTGNICRSPFAEAYLRARVPPDARVQISSAGVGAMTGQGLDPLMAEQARMRGVPADAHIARQVTGRDLLASDLILVFGPEHRDWIRDETPQASRRVFALGQVSSALYLKPPWSGLGWHQVADVVRSLRPAPDDSDWTPDPYRRGPEAAARAAEAISSAIDVIVERVR